MSDRTAIEWSDASWNPVRGCTKVSAGCKHCYAETFSERWRGVAGHPFEQGFDLRLVPGALGLPLTWKRPRRVFVNSMSDLFHEGVSFKYVAAVFGVMAACPQHTFQLLTKRAARMAAWFEWMSAGGDGTFDHVVETARTHFHLLHRARAAGANVLDHSDVGWPLPNVHLGVSTENQETADERMPLLLGCPAAVRFVSAEPLLGPLLFDLGAPGRRGDLVNWVIVGGESGPGARSCDLAWIRGIVEQCQAAGVPVFVKQLGSRSAAAGVDVHWAFSHRKGADMDEWPPDLRVREFPQVAR